MTLHLMQTLTYHTIQCNTYAGVLGVYTECSVALKVATLVERSFGRDTDDTDACGMATVWYGMVWHWIYFIPLIHLNLKCENN